jgi:hypothetical protein
MSTKVRVIKKDQRADQAPAEQAPRTKNTTELLREMTGNVSTWIKEFQQRQQERSMQDYKRLFAS